jgi:putative ABC transport system ATP-binding protein
MLWLCAHGVEQRLEDGQRSFELEIAALTLGPGARKAIVGPSGSGKTTAMDLLALAGRPRSARSFLLVGENGESFDLGRLSGDGDRMAWLRARNFGYVLQTGMLLPFLTVGENVLLAQRIAGVSDPAFARALLDELGIDAAFSTMPSALSVGQRQRVAVARALAHRPRFLFADEPTASLDPDAARRTLGTCLDIAAAANAAVLVITHDLELVQELDFDIVRIATEVRAGEEGTSPVRGGTVRAIIDDGSVPPARAPAAVAA